MATFTMDTSKIEKAIDLALFAWAKFLQDKIIQITPRDPARPPKDPSRKVTWNLKRSIGNQKISDTEYRVWVRKWYFNTEEYGSYLEFWTVTEFWTVRMKPRSFIRKWLEDNKIQVQNAIQQTFNQYINH